MRKLSVIATLCLTACASPDVSDELQVIHTALQSVQDKHGTQIEAEAREDLKAVEREYMLAKNLSFEPSDDCDATLPGGLGKCIVTTNAEEALQSQNTAETEAMSAYQVSRALPILLAYFDNLETIASAESGENLIAGAKALAENSADLASAVEAQSASDLLTENSDLVGDLVAHGADQFRVHNLRKTIEHNDESVQTICSSIASWFDEKAGILDKNEAFIAAQTAMQEVFNGPISVQQDRLKKLRAAAEELRAAYNESPGRQFELIGLLHKKLVQNVERTANLTEIVETLDLTQKLLTTIEGE